jgi:hypothetical protein
MAVTNFDQYAALIGPETFPIHDQKYEYRSPWYLCLRCLKRALHDTQSCTEPARLETEPVPAWVTAESDRIRKFYSSMIRGESFMVVGMGR